MRCPEKVTNSKQIKLKESLSHSPFSCLRSPMAAIIDCSSSSPFGYFQLNTNPKVRTSLSLSLSFISKLSVVLTLRYDEAFLANTVFLVISVSLLSLGRPTETFSEFI